MTNVITLPTAQEPEDLIWVCGHCSQSVFELHADGTTECRGCGHRGEYPDGAWADWKPTTEMPDTITRTTTVFDSKEFAQRTVVREINGDTSLLIVADDSGRIHVWSNYHHKSTEADKATVRYLCGQAVSMILGEPPLPNPTDDDDN